MGIGLLELVVIAVAALVLLGPQKLPEVLKQVGRFYVQLRRTSMEFKSAFDDVVRQAEEESRIDEIKRLTQLAKEQAAIIERQTTSITTSITEDASSGSHTQDHPPEKPEELKPLGRSNLAVQVFDNPKPELPDSSLPKPQDTAPKDSSS